MFGFTVMVIVAVFAHNPAVGVNVYSVVAVLLIAGNQVPTIPLSEVVGKELNAAPAQIGATCVNVGVTFGFTVMVIVAVFAQSPAVGVNVYSVVAVLLIAGNQVPKIPLFEVVDNELKAAPVQIGATCVNVGSMFGFTVMVIVAVFAHNPAVGVNVYSVVAVLLIAGNQVPKIPLFEVVSNELKAAPAQIGATCVNVGATLGFTVMVIVAVFAHNPAVGVNVYSVVAVLLIAGNQVPIIPLSEVVGNSARVAPAQIGVTCVNIGATFGFTTIVIVAAVAH
jgi:hypothetical protein